ncbi:MAG: 3'(2'),5'-bisphosphate nucleotidase [Planctomycetota bacterium]
MQQELEIAVAAVRQASLVCRNVQTQLAGAVLEKEDRSPVTVADFASQALICKALLEAFPSDPVVAEEAADELRNAANATVRDKVVQYVSALCPGAGADAVLQWIDHGGAEAASRFWTLDPIDGTKGFLRGEQYAVALGLIVDGAVEVAALGCPNLEVDVGGSKVKGGIFTAVRGQGAAVQPLDGDAAPSPIRVSSTADPAQARYCESVEKAHSSHSRSGRVAEAMGTTAEPVRLDSQAKYAVVAQGGAEVYLRFSRGDYKEKIWDHAAGYLVCSEAGGRTTDTSGADLDFSCGRKLERNQGVIVTNGALHDAVLAAVRATEA